ncbi:MAG TPA: carbohydrate ABC transporter permease [Streptosporangiaceae bacterium]|jgi:ABC-type glycerol-3-phosphate transport system permease component
MSAVTSFADRVRLDGWRATQGRIAKRTGFYLLISVFVIASLFPFYWMVITSLKTSADLSKGTTSLLPAHISFGSYKFDIAETSKTGVNFGQALLNSLIVAASTTVVTVVLAVLAGYALSRTRIRAKALILGFILLTSFFPVLAMVGPLFLAYRHLGLLDNYLALIITYLVYTLPIGTWFLANFFSQIPRQLEEAAVVDGATRLQALRRIILPVAVPGIFTVAILAFILAWNDFAFALSFISSPGKYTAPLAIVALGHSQYQVFYNRIDAAVVLTTLPVALIVIFAQRRIISGLTAGALK